MTRVAPRAVVSAALAVAAAVLAPLAPSAAGPAHRTVPPRAPSVSPEVTLDTSVEAFFREVDPTGRYTTFVQVHVARTKIVARSAERSFPVSVSVRVRDEATGEFVLDTDGYDQDAAAFTVAPTLRSATIRAGLTGSAQDGSSVQLGVSLDLTAAGPATKAHSRVHFREGGFALHGASVSTTRPMVAVGDVTVDGVDMVSGPSFAAPLTRLVSNGVSIVRG